MKFELKNLCLLVAFCMLPLLLSALEIDLEAGLFSIKNRYEGELETGVSYSDEELTNLRTRAFIGMSVQEEVKPGFWWGAKLLYNHRDFIERPSDLYSRGRYADLMLHPALRSKSLEIYGGPTFAIKLATDHSGGHHSYETDEVEDFATLVPGVHFGLRYPAQGSRLSMDLCANYDLLPFSKCFEVDKYQYKVMFGFNYHLFGGRAYDSLRTDSPLLRLAHSDRKEKSLRASCSWISVEDASLADFRISLERKYYFNKLAMGYDLGVAQMVINSDGGDCSLAGASRIFVGPQLSLRFGKIEPFVRGGAGAGLVVVICSEGGGGGFFFSFHAETGLRIHVSRSLGIDLAVNPLLFGLTNVGLMPSLSVSLINQ